jgi:transcriptional regulator with XRE-family HTH domain
MQIKANIKLLRKRKGRTQDDVAVSIGLKRASYTNIENGNALPSLESLVKLSDYFKVAVDTLLKVDLTKLSEFQLSELERGNDVYIRGTNLRVVATTIDSRNRENIELVNEKAKAGYTTGFADPEYISELPRFQLPFLSQNKKYRSFQISGDSMLPIPDGSWVIGEFIQNWHTINSGKAYIVLTINDGVVFKIADNFLQDDGKLTLHSLNPLYKPFDVSINDIKEVWKFINYMSADIPDSTGTESLTQSMLDLKKDMEKLKLKFKV